MHLLFVTDSYPPDDRGGLAQLCHDLAVALRARGHDVTVLCAGQSGEQSAPHADAALRRLSIPILFGDRWPIPMQQVALLRFRRWRNRRIFRQILASVKPAAVLFWPTYYLDDGLMLDAEQTAGLTTAYYLAGFSPSQPYPLEQYWQHPGRSRLARMVKVVLRPFLWSRQEARTRPRMRHVMCVSAHEQRRAVSLGADPDATTVVHNGIAVEDFAFLGLPSGRRVPDGRLRILLMGRLVPEKGAHVLVAAVGRLRELHPGLDVRATILGTGPAEYRGTLTEAIERSPAADAISVQEWIPRDRVPSYMDDFDVLVLASSIAEALPRAVQEAMARGLVVIATRTGGTPEAVRHDDTGLLFAAEDADALAECLARVAQDISLSDRLATSARHLIEREFAITLMASRVEERLAGWIQVI